MGVLSGASSNVLLGAFAGITIFLGLPVARWKGASEAVRGALALASAGILIFLIIEVGHTAIEMLESSAKSGAFSTTVLQSVIFIGGLVAGLVGLAWVEEKSLDKKSSGASPLEIANMIAIGIGLHNFAEGLAIGQSFSQGEAKLGLILVIGFALHNATEGFGIAAPLAGSEVSWGTLFLLGLIGGGPTALGAVIGGSVVNQNIELLFLSLAVGSLIYVTRELLRLRFSTLSTISAMTACTIGLLLGVATELVVEVASSKATNVSSTSSQSLQTISFGEEGAQPSSITAHRADSFTLVNQTDKSLEFEEGNVLASEAFVPAHGKSTAKIIGSPGHYVLTAEDNHKARLDIEVTAGGDTAYIDKVQAVAALTILEGHVRAACDLHMHGLNSHTPDSALDFKRAGKHAHHPVHELLEESTQKALNVQKFLKDNNLLDPLKTELDEYCKLAGDKNVDAEQFVSSYGKLLALIEKTRAACGGDAYQSPSFKYAVVREVLESAEDEYKEATATGKLIVTEAAVPGKDGYLEYQDARGFIQASNALLANQLKDLTKDGRDALSTLLTKEFADVDPADAKRPAPFATIEGLLDRITNALPPRA